MKKMIKSVRWNSVFWALAIVLILEAPSVLIIENAARILSTQEINQVGIMCIVTFLLMALVSFGLGLILFLRRKQALVKVNREDYQYVEKLKKKRFIHIIVGLIISVLPLFSAIEPAVNLFMKRGLEPKLIESYWIWLFMVIGSVIGIMAYTLIHSFLIKKVKVELDETLFVENQKKRKKMAVIAFSAVSIFALVIVTIMRNGSWLLQPYISSIPSVEHVQHEISYNSENGVYTIEAGNEDFKILQLTDIHLGGSIVSTKLDYSALEAVYKIVNNTQPDLIIITGDSVFPLGVMSFSLNNYVPMVQLASFMRNLGIPWAITFGNHDTEDIATHSEKDISKVFDQFSFAKTKSLLYPETQPNITGRSNQMILLKNGNGSIREALFLIDSNDYQSSAINDYDYIHDDQVEWYKNTLLSLEKETGKMPESLLFFHIPLQEYQTAYDLYKKGSKEVEYHFGVVGEEGEAICASNVHSALFDTAVELGSTKGMFVGHDHYNNISLTYKGIRLTYGMSIDYLAMPGIANRTEQRGGTLITIHEDSSFEVKQIPLTSLSNGTN